MGEEDRSPGHGIVQDGHRRACKGLKAEIQAEVRAEVTKEFAERLEKASFLQRLRLRLQMAEEIERRVRARAPPRDALY